MAREYGSLDAISDSYEKIIVSMDDLKFPNKKGIRHVQAWDFHSYL
jgi:predicted AAA+ superfamily ATPase